MSALQFRAVIEKAGVNPFVLVSARRAARVQKNWRKPLPVRIRVNGKPESPWRINLMPVCNGSFRLYLHGDVRQASKTKVGDRVTIGLEFDTDYKSGPADPMPAWFSAALGKHPAAATGWRRLIPSRQKEILRYFSRLKSSEAQRRNLQRAIDVLSGRKGRFMARTWNV